jgi:hypothetical protein
LRFAVHRPGNPDASPRSHGVPRRDVPGCVHIRIGGVSAGSAGKDRLALAILTRYMPTHRAALACVHRIDLLHSARSFLLQAAYQDAPASGEDLSVQRCLGLHIAPGFSDGTFRRARHVRHTQVLYPDHIEPAGQVGGELFGPVLARIDLVGLQPRDRRLDLSAAVRSPLGPGEPALEPREPPPTGWGQLRAGEHLACRQRRAHRDTAIYPYHLPGSGPIDGMGYRRKRDVPAVGPIQPHPAGLGLRDSATPTEPDPSSLRQVNLPPVPIQSLDLACPQGNDPKPLAPACLSPGGLAVGAVEIVRHRLGEITQRLLLDHHAARGQPSMLAARLGQLAAMLLPARRSRAAGSPPGLLFDGQIPYEPRVSAVGTQHLFLSGRR